MVRSGWVVTLLLLGVCTLSAQTRESVTAAGASSPSYDEFIALDFAQRRTVFATLDTASKTLLVQTHAQRWLAKNRTRLSAEQSAAVQAFADFIPEVLRDAMSRESVKRELELTKAIRCRVGETAFAEAFAILHPPPERRRAWRDVVNGWLEWIVECFD
jgi:hypothetical protein